jgi:hypothetical protein
VDVIVSIIQEYVSRSPGPETLADAVEEEFEVDFVPEFGSLAGGVVRGLGQVFAGYRGDAQLGYNPLSTPLGGYDASLTRDGATGDISAEGTADLQAGGLAGVQGEARGTRHSDGSLTGGGSVEGTTVGGGSAEAGVGDSTSSASGPNLPWSEGIEVPFL